MTPEQLPQPENLTTAAPTLDIQADLQHKQEQIEKLAQEVATEDLALAPAADTKKANCLDRLAALGHQTVDKIGTASNQAYQKITKLFQ